jgi:rSAM/selenodomain-associated transferase 1
LGQDRAIVVMGKIPRPGEVKTRLGPAELAAELYRAFLLDVFALAREGLFACAGGTDEEARALAPLSFRVIRQEGADLGARMEHARRAANARRVVIIGSDSPMMPRERIDEAFVLLEQHRAVFGPADDGGYYLIGMTGACPELLEKMTWSNDQVMAETRRRAQEAGIPTAELPRGYDLDVPEDLARALADPHLPSRSRQAIAAALASPSWKRS